MDKRFSKKIVCEGGLNTTENHILLSSLYPGSASNLINYEVGIEGGYRKINGYTELHEDEVGTTSAEGKVLGIIIFDNSTTGTTQIMAARKDTSGATYSLYLYDSGTGWSAITTGLTLTSTGVIRLRWDVGNNGANNYLVIVDGVNKAVIFDGTNWGQIDSTDTGASFAHAGGAQAIDAPTLVTFYKNTLFLGCDEANDYKGIMAYSAPNAFYDFTSANGAGQAIAKFDIVQFKPFRDELYVFGSNAIQKVTYDVTNGFLVNDVTSNIGCLVRDSVIEIGGDLIFMAPDGFRPISGTDKIGDIQLEVVSKNIHKLYKNRLNDNTLNNICSVVIRGKSQFRTFYSSESTASTTVRGIIGGLRTSDSWEFGEIIGFNPSCVTSRYIGSEEYVLHGGYDGKVYKQEEGHTLNGESMISVYSTPYLDLEDPEVRKVMEKVNLFFRAENSFTLNLNVAYDWGITSIPTPTSYAINIASEGAKYDDGSEYDDGSVYGGEIPPVSVTDIQGSFFSTKLSFVSYNSSYSHTIHGFILEYGVEGRR